MIEPPRSRSGRGRRRAELEFVEFRTSGLDGDRGYVRESIYPHLFRLHSKWVEQRIMTRTIAWIIAVPLIVSTVPSPTHSQNECWGMSAADKRACEANAASRGESSRRPARSATTRDIRDAEDFLAALPAACRRRSSYWQRSDRTVVIDIDCAGGPGSGVVEIRDGVIRSIRDK